MVLNQADLSRYWPVDGEKFSEMHDRRALREILAEGLEELSGFQKQVLTLSFYQGMKGSEIAQQLNVPYGTVRSAKFASLGILRKNLETKLQNYGFTQGYSSNN